MNQPDRSLGSGRIESLPGLPHDEDGPVFAEPWQATAFALVISLSEKGCFSWSEWVSAFSGELKAAADRGEPDDGSLYYLHWLTALERLTIKKGLTDHASLDGRKAAWIDAYLHTPHGQPVRLNAD